MDVLQETANDMMVPLEAVAPLDCKKYGIKLSLSGDHQFINAGLAVSLCRSWLKSTGNWESLLHDQEKQDSDLPEAFLRGLSTARLSGRAQILQDVYSRCSASSSQVDGSSSGELIFYLDGAHIPESMEACARWFSASIVKEIKHKSYSASSLNGYIQQQGRESKRYCNDHVCKLECIVTWSQILPPYSVDSLIQLHGCEGPESSSSAACEYIGISFSKAIFVRSMSTYRSVTSGASAIPLFMPSQDLTWQFNLQRIWEKIIHGSDINGESLKMDDTCRAVNLPPQNFIYEDVSQCSSGKDECFSCSPVFPSLPLTINWLRECVEHNPSLRIQILVTGSLHLVGDVLKLLRRS